MNWQCPYCQRHQVVSETARKTAHVSLVGGAKAPDDADALMAITSIVCANVACKRRTIQVGLHKRNPAQPSVVEALRQHWLLRPASTAKPQPAYIPSPIAEDYAEACAIRDLSPKASAALSRRCLQGMIRDFCKISKNRLIDEINELKSRIESGTAPSGVVADTMDAIDAVRSVGNIGAHMEKDINVIVDIDPGEAQSLIGLIEILLEEWYVARHTRLEKLEKLKKIAGQKKDALKPVSAASVNSDTAK